MKAGINLSKLDDPSTWIRVEGYCKDVIDHIPNLSSYEQNLENFRKANKDFFSNDDLSKIVLWKHTVGKNRIYNIKYLKSNTDEQVQSCSRKAIELAKAIKLEDCLDEDNSLSQTGRKLVQDAINELGQLKGVGPATASAVLTLIRPDIFCYLYDEVIDCFEAQRDYKISNYLRVNSRCLQIAKKLGEDWTSGRVAKTVWTAARYLAANGEDLTEDDGSAQNTDGKPSADEASDDDGEEEKRDSKRQKI